MSVDTIDEHEDASVALAVESVSVRFGSLQALSDVTIEIPRRGVVGIIGPNGAGKSTLMGVIGGQLTPTHGRVTLFGRDVTNVRSTTRAVAGLRRTFQSLELFDEMTVRENLRAGLTKRLPTVFSSRWYRSTREADERVTSLMEELGLSRYEYMEPSSLSAPVRRWVSYGRAIIGDPRCILLDEPAAGLADAERQALASRVRSDVDSREIAAVVVEHDMGFIRNLCDFIYVLNSGEIIAKGTFDEIAADRAVRDAYLGPTE